MPLLGPLGILFWAGLAIFGAGHALFWPVLAKYGGIERTKMLSVIFDEDSPMRRPENRPDRMRFRVSVFLIGIGLMTFYTSLSVGEGRELRVCQRKCLAEGHFGGYFAPSEHAKAMGRVERGCYCKTNEGGTVELLQPKIPGLNDLPPSPAASAPASVP
jgi:hypothetical protein